MFTLKHEDKWAKVNGSPHAKKQQSAKQVVSLNDMLPEYNIPAASTRTADTICTVLSWYPSYLFSLFVKLKEPYCIFVPRILNINEEEMLQLSLSTISWYALKAVIREVLLYCSVKMSTLVLFKDFTTFLFLFFLPLMNRTLWSKSPTSTIAEVSFSKA